MSTEGVDIKQRVNQLEQKIGSLNMSGALSERVQQMEQQLGIVYTDLQKSLPQRLDEIQQKLSDLKG